MAELQNSKRYDLEERTFCFAKKCRNFIMNLSKSISNIEDGKQLIRSSGSVAANYIEANEAISKKDFLHRIKICRKETKESCLWLGLCNLNDLDKFETERSLLIQETNELMKIFGAIYN